MAFPLSILDISKISLMSASRNLAEFSTLSRQSHTRSGSSHDSLAMESIPMIAFMGVRMSWDMRERKSDLARLARSVFYSSDLGASGWRHLASISSSGISSVLMTESICSILSQSSAGKRLRTRSMTVCR